MTQNHSMCLSNDGFQLPYTVIESKNEHPQGFIIYFHGGGLIFGQRDDLPQAYIDILTESYHLVLVSIDWHRKAQLIRLSQMH